MCIRSFAGRSARMRAVRRGHRTSPRVASEPTASRRCRGRPFRGARRVGSAAPTPPARSARSSCGHRLQVRGRGVRVGTAALGGDGGVLDPAGEPIDQSGRAFEKIEIGAFGPRGEVRDRVVLGGDAKRANAGVRDRLGDELFACVDIALDASVDSCIFRARSCWPWVRREPLRSLHAGPLHGRAPDCSRCTLLAVPAQLICDGLAVVIDQRGLDAAGERIDELRELGDRFKRSVLAPAGDVGDRFAGGVEAGGAENDQRGGFMPGLERFELWRGRPGLAGSVTCFLFVLPM